MQKQILPLAESIGWQFVEPSDVTTDTALDNLFTKAATHFGTIDFLVYCIAFANRDDLSGRFIDINRDGFRTALDISCYSLIALAQRTRPLMP